MKYYDTRLFIEIIESVKGVKFIRRNEYNGFHQCVYEGVNGRSVTIDTTDEDIPYDLGSAYLDLLGLAHMITALFPTEPHVSGLNTEIEIKPPTTEEKKIPTSVNFPKQEPPEPKPL